MCQQDEEEVDGDDGGSSNLVVVPKKGKVRRLKPNKNDDENMQPSFGGYAEKQ